MIVLFLEACSLHTKMFPITGTFLFCIFSTFVLKLRPLSDFCLHFFFCFCFGVTPPVGQGLLIHEVSRSHK